MSRKGARSVGFLAWNILIPPGSEVKPDNRKSDMRPAVPINTDLTEILSLLENVTDPFLVFL